MSERFWCANCNQLRELNRFGYCEVCGSDQLMPDRPENHILEQFPHAIPNESYQQWLDRLRREAKELAK